MSLSKLFARAFLHQAQRKAIRQYYDQDSVRRLGPARVLAKMASVHLAKAIDDDVMDMPRVDVFLSYIRPQRERALAVKTILAKHDLTVAMYNPERKWALTWTRILNLILHSSAVAFLVPRDGDIPDYKFRRRLLVDVYSIPAKLKLGKPTALVLESAAVQWITNTPWITDIARWLYRDDPRIQRLYGNDLIALKHPPHPHSNEDVDLPVSRYVYDEIAIAKVFDKAVFGIAGTDTLQELIPRFTSLAKGCSKNRDKPDTWQLLLRLCDEGCLDKQSGLLDLTRQVDEMFFEDFPERFSEVTANGILPPTGPRVCLNLNYMLIGASFHGHVQLAKSLVAEGASVNGIDAHGQSPLFFASAKGHTAFARHLLDAGANPNALTTKGLSPLHMASQNGHKDIVVSLFESGADLSLTNFLGETALYLAARNGHPEIVSVLLSHGAPTQCPREDGDTPLSAAIRARHTVVTSILEKFEGTIQ